MFIQETDIYAAAQRLQHYAHKTPLQRSRSFDEQAAMEVVFKCEQWQRTGAFKYRGAFNKIASLSAEQRRRGVIAYSSGNHAQAVALAAQHLATPATVYMPQDAPAVKIAAVQGYGAEIQFYNRHMQKREALAQDLAQKRQLTLVPPASDPAIIAGHATVALELLQEVPDIDVLAVPVGGGGLLAGTCLSTRLLAPQLKVVGVQTLAANHGYLSLRQQQRVTIAPPETIADGLRTTALGALNWPIIQSMAEDILLVSEEEVFTAMRFLLLRLKMVIEPSGAVAAAAALAGKLRRYGRRAGIVLSGGNVDPGILASILEA
jgi:threonine dehydratase